MSDFPEWAAFAGMATNRGYNEGERLSFALKAIEGLESELAKVRAQAIQVVTGVSIDAPPAWRELIEGLTLISKGQVNRVSPFHCEHDELRVMADPASFTAEELAKLEKLGFSQSEDGNFYSFRFGSA